MSSRRKLHYLDIYTSFHCNQCINYAGMVFKIFFLRAWSKQMNRIYSNLVLCDGRVCISIYSLRLINSPYRDDITDADHVIEFSCTTS